MPIEMVTLTSREEWLLHRQNYIGGSEASAIIGLNPYMDNVRLWEIKTGLIVPEDISGKPYVKFGTNAEAHIRELFKLTYPQYEVFYEENNSWVNDKQPFAAASLDGWLIEKETGRHGIWECKTSEIVSSMHKEKWHDQIPQNYFVQILHYMMIRDDCEFAHLTALLTYKFETEEVFQQIRNYHIERSDVQGDIDFLARKEAEYWEFVKKKQRPALVLPEI